MTGGPHGGTERLGRRAPIEGADAVAAALPVRLDRDALAGLVDLLDADVRWGGDGADTEETCRTREDVAAWLNQLLDVGVTVEMAITAVHRDKVVLRLGVGWPGAEGTDVRYDSSLPGLASSSTCGQPTISRTHGAGQD